MLMGMLYIRPSHPLFGTLCSKSGEREVIYRHISVGFALLVRLHRAMREASRRGTGDKSDLHDLFVCLYLLDVYYSRRCWEVDRQKNVIVRIRKCFYSNCKVVIALRLSAMHALKGLAEVTCWLIVGYLQSHPYIQSEIF